MNLHILVYLVSNFFLTIAIARFMKVFFEERRTSLFLSISSYAFYYVATSAAFLLLNIPIVSLTISVFTIFLISLNYEAHKIKRVAFALSIYLYFFLVDIIVSASFGYFDFSIIEEVGYSQTIGYAISVPLWYLGSVVAHNLKNLKRDIPVLPIFWITTFFIPISSIFISTLIVTTSNLPQIFTVTIMVLIFLVNLLTFYLNDQLSASYANRLELELRSQEREYFYAQCRLMQDSADNIKSIKHDINNHLISLKNYAQQNDICSIAKYLNNLLEETEMSRIFSETGNIAFDGVINYKLTKAKTVGIDTNLEIKIPSDLNIDVADVAIIFGNLLDNALEALEKVQDKWLNIKVSYDKGCVFFRMNNSFDGEIKYADGKIISSSGKAERGLGLYNIRKAIDKYNGEINITHDNNIFSVIAMIYVDPSI